MINNFLLFLKTNDYDDDDKPLTLNEPPRFWIIPLIKRKSYGLSGLGCNKL